MTIPPVRCRTALVTGCSSGIGRATAVTLRDAGWRVAATARGESDLDRLRSDGFEAVALDLGDGGSVERAASDVLSRFADGLGALVNNAGFAQFGAVEDVTREDLRRQFEVNVFGTHELTRRLLPTFRRQGWGRIVQVSSVYGRVTAPMVGAYCASKHALESLTDALRMELHGSGVWVTLIEPGAIRTEFRRNATAQAERTLDPETARFGDRYRRMLRRDVRTDRRDRFALPPEAVARKILRAIESPRPRARYRVTVPAHVAAVARRLAPTAVLDRLLGGSVRRSSS